jgi:glycosyltransferase involved in cell wall biosynthesis
VAPPLALGVDAANLPRDRRGMGRYVRSVLHEFTTRLHDRVRVTLLVPDLLPRLVARRYVEDLEGDIAVARRSHAGRLGLDVVWYPWNGMTWESPVRSVATVHDVWPFVAPAPDRRVRVREQTQYRVMAERASLIIAVSEFTKREIVRHLGVAPEAIRVIPQGVAAPLPVTAPARTGSARYVLFVGEVEPRKDIETLLTAMTRLPSDVASGTSLVVVGRSHGLDARALPGIACDFVGEVEDDARLAELYAGAAVFAFPSKYEGFGLPVLEAMSYGAPVVASDAASIPEVGGDAALYFPCGDADALAATLTRVLRDAALAQRMRLSGLGRAALFDEATRARRTLEALESVVTRQPLVGR